MLHFLPFHFVRLGTLKPGILLRLLVMPLLCVLASWASVGSLQSVSQWLPSMAALGNLLTTPPEKVVEFIYVFVVMSIGVAGYVFGWVINMIALVLAKRHPAHVGLEVILRGRVPEGWQAEGAAAKVRAAVEKERADWRYAQETGWLRYVVLRGGIVFGSVAFVGVHVLLNIAQSQPIVLESLPWKFVLWVLFGALLTACRWLALSNAYRSEA